MKQHAVFKLQPLVKLHLDFNLQANIKNCNRNQKTPKLHSKISCYTASCQTTPSNQSTNWPSTTNTAKSPGFELHFQTTAGCGTTLRCKTIPSYLSANQHSTTEFELQPDIYPTQTNVKLHLDENLQPDVKLQPAVKLHIDIKLQIRCQTTTRCTTTLTVKNAPSNQSANPQ